MSTPAQIAANQANAKLSTGPKTEAGKSISSQNNFRHGLSGAFLIQTWEDPNDYSELLDGLRAEHRTATPTETLLVERMAQHWWLGQRALRIQDLCFEDDAPMLQSGNEKEFALYLRYQTTHERAFGKCLNDLQKLRAQRLRELRGFESQKRQKADECRKQEMHEARLEAVKTKTELVKAKAARPTTETATESTASIVPAFATRTPEILALDPQHEAEPQAFLNKAA